MQTIWRERSELEGEEYVGVDVHAPIPLRRDGPYPRLISAIATSLSPDSPQTLIPGGQSQVSL